MADPLVTPADYATLAKTLHERCAMALDPGKEYLIHSRLTPVAQRRGLSTANEVIALLRGLPPAGLVDEIVEAMVTTETSFFRDIFPFETLKKTVLPGLIAARSSRRELNIWCAAASTGQEPYTIAIVLREHFPELLTWRVRLRATDISRTVLDRARSGVYSQIEVNRGLPAATLMKWFRQEGAQWRIDDRIRQSVEFDQQNLTDPWPTTTPVWDLVFIRNVMIYFDNATKTRILGRLAKTLAPDGYMVLGGAETTYNLDDSFERVDALKSGYFRLKSNVKR